MKNVLIYISCPISKGDLFANIKQADAAFLALMKADFAVFNPTSNCYVGDSFEGTFGVWSYARPHPNGTTSEQWYAMDRVIVQRCDGVLRLLGESVGADLEVAEAKRLGKPVFYSVEEVIAHPWNQ